jgi:hypothetical protein
MYQKKLTNSVLCSSFLQEQPNNFPLSSPWSNLQCDSHISSPDACANYREVVLHIRYPLELDIKISHFNEKNKTFQPNRLRISFQMDVPGFLKTNKLPDLETFKSLKQMARRHGWGNLKTSLIYEVKFDGIPNFKRLS